MREVYRDTDKVIEVDDATGEQCVTWTNPAADGAILDAIRATASAAHTEGEPWVQPTGAHDAVPLGVTVTDGGKTWRSLHPANVWRPDPSSRYWEVVSGEPGPEPWSAGTYYRIDNKVTYNGQTWNCTHEHLGQVGWEPNNPTMHSVWKLIQAT